jgi:hypothetical protein
MASVDGIRQAIEAGDQHLRDAQIADVEEAVRALSINSTGLILRRLLAGLRDIDQKAQGIRPRITDVSVAGSMAYLEYVGAIEGSTALDAGEMFRSANATSTKAGEALEHLSGFSDDLQTAIGLLASAETILAHTNVTKYAAAVSAMELATVSQEVALEASDRYKDTLG